MNSDTQKTVDLVFVIHNHQPVGNFDFVIEQNYQESYEPFIGYLERYPFFKTALHYTGYLWEYIAEKHPEFIERIKALIDRNQVELVGGSYYESVISVLPEYEAVRQLSIYSDSISRYSGKNTEGMWLAERVWEPGMPSVISKSGYGYTFLDQSHFEAGGVPGNKIWGIYKIEDRGNDISVFPIDKTLRYNIPFQLPNKTVEYLARRKREGVKLITYGDDGEKFGGWPGTKKWVYEDKWLENFLITLQENDWINLVLPSEAAAKHSIMGKVYLPCASYEEMGEWSLPAATQVELFNLKKELEHAGLAERVEPMIRGGYWRQFLTKYPESGRIYRRLLRVCRMVEEMENSKHPEAVKARQHLMRGSANDAYWHGVFGGIYLPHLRYAVTKDLIAAETIFAKSVTVSDIHEYPNSGTVSIENDYLKIEIEPELGGGISAIDVRNAGINLADSMTRRDEAYHVRLKEATEVNEADHSSIHDRIEAKEENLLEKLITDDHQRLCFLDRFLKSAASLDELKKNKAVDISCVYNSLFTVIKSEKREAILEGCARLPDSRIKFQKIFSLSESESVLKVEYKFGDEIFGIDSVLFAPEIHLNLLAPSADDRYFLHDSEKFDGCNLGSQGESQDTTTISLVDEYLGIRIDLTAKPQAKWMWYPIETVSLSEGGAESVYQGSGIHPVWQLNKLSGITPVVTLSVKA